MTDNMIASSFTQQSKVELGQKEGRKHRPCSHPKRALLFSELAVFNWPLSLCCLSSSLASLRSEDESCTSYTRLLEITARNVKALLPTSSARRHTQLTMPAILEIN